MKISTYLTIAFLGLAFVWIVWNIVLLEIGTRRNRKDLAEDPEGEYARSQGEGSRWFVTAAAGLFVTAFGGAAVIIQRAHVIWFRLTTPTVCSWCRQTMRRAWIPVRREPSHSVCPRCALTAKVLRPSSTQEVRAARPARPTEPALVGTRSTASQI